MDSNTMRRLCEHLHDQRSGRGDYNRTDQQPGFDTTLNQDVDSEQGNRSGDGRRSKDQPG